MNATAIQYERDATGRLRPTGAVYNGWQGSKRHQIVNNAADDLNEEPLPLPTMNGHHEKVVENALDDDVLPLPVMDFGSVRRPALKKDSELTLNDDDVLPLPNWDWCRENE